MDLKRKKIRVQLTEEKQTDFFNISTLAYFKSADIAQWKPQSISDTLYWKDCVYCLLHAIIQKAIKEDFKKGSNFVSLNFDELKKLLGKDTKTVIDVLIKKRVIERDGKYKKGAFSFGYKIKPKYWKASYIKYKTLTHRAIKKRYKKYRDQYFENWKRNLYEHDFLVTWLIDEKLKLDNIQAQIFIDFWRNTIRSYFKAHTNLNKQEITDILSEPNTFWKSHSPLHEEITTNKLPTFSNRGNRLFSWITALNSPLRNFLTYDGGELVYLDISNSQPFHFLIFLTSKFWEFSKQKNTLSLNNLNPELYTHIEEKYNKQLGDTIMTLKTAERDSETGYKGNKNVLHRGYQKERTFSSLVMNGKLYEFISSNFKNKFKKNNIDPFKNRENAKKQFIKMLYAENKNRHVDSSTYYKAFKKLFPFESSIIDLLKSKNYTEFSVLLQQIESRILLRNICKRIHQKDNSIPLFTIHDGIITTNCNEMVIKNEITATYKEILGVSPELKTEKLNKANLDFETFKKTVIKKTKKIAENNSIDWIDPEEEFWIKHLDTYTFNFIIQK
jgi:hypothetical protein